MLTFCELIPLFGSLLVRARRPERVTYFIRLPANSVLNSILDPYLTRPVGRPPKSGIQTRLVDLR